MEREGEATGPSQRTWTLLIAVGWALLGLWAISDGQIWLGLGQLVLGVLNVLVLVSPRARRSWMHPSSAGGGQPPTDRRRTRQG